MAGIAAEGAPYRGALFCEMMIENSNSPAWWEFNARFGDPECQVCWIQGLESDLVSIWIACATGRLAEPSSPPIWREEAAICVCAGGGRLPGGSPRTGSAIGGAEADFGPDSGVPRGNQSGPPTADCWRPADGC